MKTYFGSLRQRLTASALIVGLLMGATVVAQDTTHPKDMQLPAGQFERPSPEAMQVVLDNGLVAYVAEDHRAPLVTLSAFIGVGTGHGAPGDAPALAAALRKGPGSLSAGEFQEAILGMNAVFRVTQHHEVTEILFDVPASALRQAVTLLGELISEPAFEGMESGPKERAASGAIDYNYSLSNAVALFNDRLFAGHPFARSATDEEHAMAADTGAKALHKRFVVAKNITVAIAGDFKRSAAVKDARRALAMLSPTEAPRPESFPALTPLKQPHLILSDANRIQGWVVIGHELPKVPPEDEAALAVMDYILGAYHLDSRLYRSSRELRGLTNDNSSFLEPGVQGPGAYSFRTYGRPEVVRLLVDITFRELASIRESLVSADELFVAKGALVDGIYAKRYATGVDATHAFAREWLTSGSHENSASYPRRVAAVSAESVKAAAVKYIHPDRMIVAVLGPLEKIDAAPALESEPLLATWGASER